MPQYNRNELDLAARSYGFTRDTFEKVLRLKEILARQTTQSLLNEHANSLFSAHQSVTRSFFAWRVHVL